MNSKNNQIKTLIQQFNTYLAQQDLLKQYQITPFIEHYPLHITLYLANYKPQQEAAIISIVSQLANQQTAIPISSKQFIAMSGGYVMLTINKNKVLQTLSNEVVHALAPLRDPQAAIPPWAAQDPKRQKLFRQFGSPGVFALFNPHFSILDPDHLNAHQQQQLQEKLQRAIRQFKATHLTQVHALADKIAVGIANEKGQITRELAYFSLKPRNAIT